MSAATTVTINGEARTLAAFSGFKALYAIDTIGSVETVVRQLVKEEATFRQEYTARVVAGRQTLTMSRVEARRQFGPQPLYEAREGVLEAVVVDGKPVTGPDPLGHLTDADWEASGQQLVIPQIPDDEGDGIDNAVMMAMVPSAFRQARQTVMRLIALVVTSNADLEKWETAGEDIDAELDVAARELAHRSDAAELIGLAVAAVTLTRDQIAGPFGEAVTAVKSLFGIAETDTTPTPAQEPMVFESAAETPSSPGSSTSSPGDTAATPPPGFTEPAGVSS